MAISKLVKPILLIICSFCVFNVQPLHATALTSAIFAGDYGKVESLLKTGGDPIDKDEYRSCVKLAMVLAHHPEQMKILGLLIQHMPDLDEPDMQGNTILMNAIECSRWEIAESLVLSHNLDLTKINKSGNTALMLAYDWAEHRVGENTTRAKRLVDLLSSRMSNPVKKMTIPRKSCFLSFEQEDDENAITKPLCNSIDNVVTIVVPQLLKEVFKNRDEFIHLKALQEECKAGKMTFLASKFKLADGVTPQLLVIIPESFDELGIKIPESEKQNAEPNVDISLVEKKYGFKNLTLLNPEFVVSIVKNSVINENETRPIFENFPKIIDVKNPAHPTRFCLQGHGSCTKNIIASLSTDEFGDFLKILEEIGAEFLYLFSCFSAGPNLQQMQSSLANIISKQSTNQALLQAAYKKELQEYEQLMLARLDSEPLKYPNIETYSKLFPIPNIPPLPGIDFPIILQAVAATPTSGFGNLKAMFRKLDEFLKTPVWALEFGPGVKKPKITISDVINEYGLVKIDSLPSIRMPGKLQFFRPINCGKMEIITESRLIERGVEDTMQLIADSKSLDNTIAAASRKKLCGYSLEIDVSIKPEIQYIQILPMDLMDFAFFLSGQPLPPFISKFTGKGQHFIGKIIVTSDNGIKQIINSVFNVVFNTNLDAHETGGYGYLTDRCWFIKLVDMPTSKTHINKLAIHLSTKDEKAQCEYAYINEKDEYIIGESGKLESKTDKETFVATVRKWFEETIPSQATLREAIGSAAVTPEEKVQLEKTAVGEQVLKLFKRFTRGPRELFNIFMAPY